MRWLLPVAALVLLTSAPLATAAMASLSPGGPLLVQTEPTEQCRAVVCAPVEHVGVDLRLPADPPVDLGAGLHSSETFAFPDVPVHASCPDEVCGDVGVYASVADRPLLGEFEAEAHATGPSAQDAAMDDAVLDAPDAVAAPAAPVAPAPPARLTWRASIPTFLWRPAPLAPRATPASDGPDAPAPVDEPLAVAAVTTMPKADPQPWSAPERAAAVALLALALAAYSRISSRNAALTSPVRARIHEIVQRDGVVALPRIAEELQLGRTTIEHHLRVLERCGILVVSREGRAVLVSLPGMRVAAPPPEVRRSPACQALLAILASRPEGIPREDLHKAAPDIPVRTRNHAIKALAQRGLVTEADGRFVARGAGADVGAASQG